MKSIMLNGTDIAGFLPVRNDEGHKGSFGHLLSVCGSGNMTGAAYFAAAAALRTGVGLVTAASPACALTVLQIKLSEPVFLPLDGIDGMLSEKGGTDAADYSKKCTAAVIGCGLGRSDEVSRAVSAFLSGCDIPVVADADALNACAGLSHPFSGCRNAVITPHPLEFSRLTGLSTDEIASNRKQLAAQYSRAENVITVLKGAYTVIAAPDGKTAVSPYATSALAKGGSGDVLTGIIGGFLAQGLEPYRAALLGVWLHGLCAVLASRSMPKRCVLPSDLLCVLPRAVKQLEETPEN